MAIGYFINLADAEDYFIDERLETECWDDLGSGSGTGLKEKAIFMAYNRIYYDPRWDLPTYPLATAAELVVLRKANAEMAYYLTCHLADEDRRKGIQAQGVIEAGVVKEKYHQDWLAVLPVPPFVESMLAPWLVGKKAFGAIDLARDEDESVNTKVHDF
jgi:hypothetical protein